MIGLPIVSFDFATADVTTTAGLGENSLAIVSTQRRPASSAKSPRTTMLLANYRRARKLCAV